MAQEESAERPGCDPSSSPAPRLSTSASSEDVRPIKPSARLYVGNMHSSMTEGDLIKIFLRYGNVRDVTYLWHRFGPNRGQPKGFGFVEMSSITEARNAIVALDGEIVKGRKLHVSYSDEMPEESSSGGYRGGGRGRGYSRSGGLLASSVQKRKTMRDASARDSTAGAATAPSTDDSIRNEVPKKKQRTAVDNKLDKLRTALSQLEKIKK